jgi:hypothetical protein
MNSALRMLLAAMMRARCSGELRSWTSAYIGTMKKPPNMPSISRSNSTRQTAGMASRASSSCGAAPASPVGEAK